MSTVSNVQTGRRLAFACVMVLLLAFVSAVHGSSSATAAANASTAPQYRVILSNPFIGNDWRPQMQTYASVVASRPPLNAFVSSLRIVTTQDNDPNLQISALQSAILEKPDILLVDAASETALNGIIQQACNANITVVTFDVPASAPCAWKLAPDWVAVGRAWAQFAVKTTHAKGPFAIDKGVPGAGSSNQVTKGIAQVLSKYPKIKKFYYYSKFDPGAETRQMTQILAAHPDVTAIISQSYAAQVAQKKAGVRLVSTGFTFPDAMSGCITRNLRCLLIGVPPWMSADAVRLGVDIRRGKVTGEPRFIPFQVPLFVNNSSVTVDRTNLGPLYSLAKQAKSAPKGAFLPVSPPWTKVDFTKDILHK